MSNEGLLAAIRIAGSQSELARRVGGRVKQQHIHLWLRIGLPGDMVLPVARAVGFQVTPHEINPQIYPNPGDGLPANSSGQAQEVA